MKDNDNKEKDIKAIRKSHDGDINRSNALQLKKDYSKLINTLDQKRNSATHQINVINEFFKNYPKVNINKLSESIKIKYAGNHMEYDCHPLIELMDVNNYKHKVSKPRVKVIEALLNNNVSPDLSDTDFIEPLMTAVYTKDHVVARLLLKHGANPNCLGENDIPVLFTAAAKLDKEMVKILLDYKADVNIKNKYNRSYPKLKNHNVLAYMFRSNNGETQDRVYHEGYYESYSKMTVEMG